MQLKAGSQDSSLQENLPIVGYDSEIHIQTIEMFTFISLKVNHHWNKSLEN
jgi:hypothetical protein